MVAELFADYGVCEHDVVFIGDVTNQDLGSKSHFRDAYITFPSLPHAEDAIKDMEGVTLMGKYVLELSPANAMDRELMAAEKRKRVTPLDNDSEHFKRRFDVLLDEKPKHNGCEWRMRDVDFDNITGKNFLDDSIDAYELPARNPGAVVPKAGALVVGSIKSYDFSKGFGFFCVPALGRDVLLTQEWVPRYMRDQIFVGREATFTLREKPGRKFDAINVNFDYGGGLPIERNVPNATSLPYRSALVDGETYGGQIKSYRVRDGHGFIACAMSRMADIVFHSADVTSENLSANDFVSFQVSVTPTHVAAVNVTAVDAATYDNVSRTPEGCSPKLKASYCC
eukprot:GEMP01022031.1.p1 GENE.GEMP01022031.1~~GEMP01022031.1.p1  ORF type:complete len:339 (+),score=77.46 GEMP01022031.1:1432-2448(+)